MDGEVGGADSEDAGRGRVTGRLAGYYLVLILLVVGVATFAMSTGSEKSPAPSIAGGYDVTLGDACLGEQFNVTQSGQFVTLTNTGNTLDGNLRFRDGKLDGSVDCVNGETASMEATAEDGKVAGTLGGIPLDASLERQPPDPGTPAPKAPSSIAGEYALSPVPACLGNEVELEGGDGEYHAVADGEELGSVSYDRKAGGTIAGEVRCVEGGIATVEGTANDRRLDLTISATGEPPASTETAPPEVERATATKSREFIKGVEAFLLAVVVIMLFARLVGGLMPRIGQPRVMGEVIAGILLGPTLLGAIAPDLQAAIFPSDVIPYIGVAANLGLVFYMFLVGLELDLGQLRGRFSQTLVISNTGVAVPMIAGMLIAIPVYQLVAPDNGFAGFALFMGVSMSITAFPVLARIIVEKRMLRQPLGVLALSSAAIDDVTAWFLIALASSVATAGASFSKVIQTIALTIAFCLVMALLVRRVLNRAAVAFDESGQVPGGWITVIFAGVLLSAFVTEAIGVALIFGAFVMGLAMPRHAGLTEEVTKRTEDFVVKLLLPLFFVYTGLRTDVVALGQAELLLLTLVLCLVAVACKFGGTIIAARFVRMSWRESAVLATLMNTRGLTELIVLNLALEKGVISPALFSALVMMALITTFMAGPLLKRFDRNEELGEDVAVDLEIAQPGASTFIEPVEGSILIVPQGDATIDTLTALGKPLVTMGTPREMIITRLLQPNQRTDARGGFQNETRRLSETTAELNELRLKLLDEGVMCRTAAFTSTDPGTDILKVADREDVDLVLLDGRRPLLGGGVPRGGVGTVLSDAACDVAVLVARESDFELPGPGRPVVVPFGGAEHDWAALELGARLATATGAPLVLLGSGGGDSDSSRLLGHAAMLVQRFVGISAEPRIVESGRQGLMEAASDASLLMIGLKDDWSKSGLGEVRSEIARSAPAPILFVRRGSKPGALAPASDHTRFSWSSTNVSLK